MTKSGCEAGWPISGSALISQSWKTGFSGPGLANPYLILFQRQGKNRT